MNGCDVIRFFFLKGIRKALFVVLHVIVKFGSNLQKVLFNVIKNVI